MCKNPFIELRISYHEGRPLYPLTPRPSIHPKVLVEIGPGHGAFLIHLAETNRDALIYAIEIREKRVLNILSKLEKRNIKNVVMVCADAHYAFSALFFNRLVDDIYINFPDPWPKERHARNRLLQRFFFERLATHLKPNGALHVVTDDPLYAKQVKKETTNLLPLIETTPDEIFPSIYYRRWKRMGRAFFPMKWIISPDVQPHPSL